MKKLTPKATLWLVLILVMVWGINWPLTKLALPDTPPIFFSGIRTLLGWCDSAIVRYASPGNLAL